jgi:protein TonB
MNVIDELTKGKYGSMELKRYVGPNLIRGLIFSVLIHSAVIAAPWIVTFFKGEDAIPDKVYVLDENILRKLKQLKPGQAPPKIARPKLAPPKVSIPIAVKEEDLPEEQPEIMKQEDLAQQIVEEYAQYDTLAIDPNAQIVVSDEVIPDAGVFIPFEVPPQPLADFSPQPAYPDIAQKAGTSGKVVAQVYVDKEGNVKKWKIVQAKPEGLGFEQEVEKVITKWRFTPAIQQGNPVGVWIAIPFTFKVKQ